MGQKLSDAELYQMAETILQENPDPNNFFMNRLQYIAEYRCELTADDCMRILDAFNLYVLKGRPKWTPRKTKR